MKLIMVFMLVSVALMFSCGSSFVMANDNAANKWENEINKFMEWDSKNYYPREAVLFVGSSSIVGWNTYESFPDMVVLNRGFGGSQMSDLLYYYDKVVLKYRPKIIVLYSGDNDIAGGKTWEVTSNDYMSFFALTHKKLPETKIVVLPIKPSSMRWNLWPSMNKVNLTIKEYSQNDDMVYYVDLASCLLTKDEVPDNRFFKADKLHLNPDCYKVWTAILKKAFDEIM